MGEVVDPRSHLNKAHFTALIIALDTVDPVHEPGPHVQQRHHPDNGHSQPSPGDGHQVSGSVIMMASSKLCPKYLLPCGLADVDIPLHRQHQGEVDAGVVEQLGHGLYEHLK